MVWSQHRRATVGLISVIPICCMRQKIFMRLSRISHNVINHPCQISAYVFRYLRKDIYLSPRNPLLKLIKIHFICMKNMFSLFIVEHLIKERIVRKLSFTRKYMPYIESICHMQKYQNEGKAQLWLKTFTCHCIKLWRTFINIRQLL